MKDGSANIGYFGCYVAKYAVALIEVEPEHAKSVFAHFLAVEEFIIPPAEIEAGLDFLSHECHAEIEVGQQQTALPIFCEAVGDEIP